VIKRANLHFFCWVITTVFLAGCSTTRRLPDDASLLNRNKLRLNQSGIDQENLHAIIKQRPNGRILGVPFSLYIYNWGRPGKDGFFTRIGEAPVVFDSISASRSLDQMILYLQGRGYFQVTGQVQAKQRRRTSRKTTVNYVFDLGERYRISLVRYDIQTLGLRDLVFQNFNDRLVEEGSAYDSRQLEQERDRLSRLFRDHGYFDFPKDLIRVDVDTSRGPQNVELLIRVLNLSGRIGDSTFTKTHEPYRVNHVYLLPGFDYLKGMQAAYDTARFMGYDILYPGEEIFSRRVLQDVIHFSPGELYKESAVRKSYNHINSLRVFRSAEINFERDTTSGKSNDLQAFVKLAPFRKRSFTTEFQTINTSGNFGISGNIGWINRNTFKGGEVLEFRFGGGIDAQANFRDDADRIFNTTQYQGEVILTFPRFILPVQTLGVFPKSMMPTTRMSISYSRQVRLEFDRAVFNMSMRYQWRESDKKTHQLNLIDLNYLNAIRVDQLLLDNLLFVNNFQDNFIAAIRYSFTYNEQAVKRTRHQNYFSAGIEFAGNFISVFDQIYDFPINSDGRAELLGVPYAQYARLDADYRHFWNMPFDQQLVFRLMGGLSYGYNNSQFGAPFEKLYFGGGSYDIRAWRAYNLGPGSVPEEIFETIPRARYVATAPIKLMLNLEYRVPFSRTLPIFKDLRGALFTDIGNIWWNRAAAGQFKEGDLFEPFLDDFIFSIERFYKQLAVGGGIGIRYDLTFFVIRLDVAYKIRDPAKPIGANWLAEPLRFNTLTYNIAIGYPF
jgi:outer membrane protein assembly factor BamA